MYRFFLLLLILLSLSSSVYATPEYSEKTKQGCKVCHVRIEGGGELTKLGLQYAASGYTWPPKGGFRVLGPIRKTVRLLIGFLHFVFSFLWFGTILYVHIILRPGYAARGLPRGEVSLGILSMAGVGITGLLLTISRVRGIDVLFVSKWGNILLLKIILYLLMVSMAVFVLIYIGPRLKSKKRKAMIPKDRVFDPLTLSSFDGKDGSPAFIAYKNKVYDVTNLKLWKNGVHMKHLSGQDLTEALKKAPHGEEKLKDVPIVGSYDPAHKSPKTFAQKAFYFIAYTNLFLVFIVLFVIAYWRWGL